MGVYCQRRIIIAVRHQHRGCSGMSGSLDLCDIKCKQPLTLFDLIALVYQQLEPLPLHTDRINTDMNQKFHTAGTAYANGVECIRIVEHPQGLEI